MITASDGWFNFVNRWNILMSLNTGNFRRRPEAENQWRLLFRWIRSSFPFPSSTREFLLGHSETHNIEDYRPEKQSQGSSKAEREAEKSHLIGWERESRENWSKYLPFQFVYKFLLLLPDTGYKANTETLLRRKENFNLSKCLAHEWWCTLSPARLYSL